MLAYLKWYDGETIWMYFLIKGDDLLRKYDDIWNKVRKSISKNFDSKPICYKNFLKTKIKSCGDNATNFHDKKIPEVGFNYTYLAVILINVLLKKDANYYLQVFLKECKYIEKEKKVIRYIISFF